MDELDMKLHTFEQIQRVVKDQLRENFGLSGANRRLLFAVNVIP